MNIVLDSSVVLKWFLRENKSKEALAIRISAVQNENILHTTELLFFEFTNSLATKNIPEEEEKRMILDLYITPFTIHPFDALLATESLQLAQTHHVSVYDASFCVLAQTLDCNFLTADARLKDKLQNLSFVKLL